MKKFEIKISKKTRRNFKIFGQNRIQKFEVAHPTKIREGKTEGKLRKKRKRPVPYKGVTLGPYPLLLEPLSKMHAPPLPRVVGFLDLPPGRRRSGLPDLSTGKPRLLAVYQ
jgi:hypothetical protein